MVRFGKVKIYEGWMSILHTIVAILSVILNISIPATLIFIAYQYFEKEKWMEKRGDFVEWLVGLIIGGLVKSLI